MRKFAEKIWNNEFYQGGIFFTAASLLVNFLSYVFNVIVGRTLGPQGYGEISSLFSYISISSIPVLVLSALIIQKIGQSSDNQLGTAYAMENWLIAKIKRWWWSLLIVLLAIPFISRITNLSLTTSITLLPLVLLTIISSLYIAFTQGLKLFKVAAFISVGAILVKLAGAILVWLHIDGLATICLFLLVSSFYSFVASRKAMHASATSSIQIPHLQERIFEVMKSTRVILTTCSILGITLLSNLDIIFVKKFFSADDAGIYSSWSLFAKVILYLINPLIAVSFVYFANRKTANQHERALLYALGCLGGVAIVSFIGYSYLGKILIALVFGQKFNPVIPYLYLASIFGSLYTGLVFLNNYFLARKSNLVFILPMGLPIYIALLFLSRTNLEGIMLANIYFTTSVVVLYILGFIYSMRK